MSLGAFRFTSIATSVIIHKRRYRESYPRPSNPQVAAIIFSDKMSEKIEVVNIRLSPEIIKIIDSLIDQGIYSSRSEFIRDVCRDYALEERYKNE